MEAVETTAEELPDELEAIKVEEVRVVAVDAEGVAELVDDSTLVKLLV